jgi:GNAT superfamily N-acetyltransferase
MLDNLIIRRGELKDAVTLSAYNLQMAMETENKRLDPYVVSGGVKAVLQDEAKGVYFVADLGGRVIGQLMITTEWSDWRNGDMWWIQSVYVHLDFRKQGVFTALYAYAEEQAKKAEAVALRLYVEKDNAAAQETYGALGMETSHYLVMEKTLPRG